MAGRKCNITASFRRTSTVNMQWTSGFSFIPSSDKNFVCLLGLEEVVHFRLERLDKIVYALPGKREAKGKKKLFSVQPSAPASSPPDPFTCSECNTDVSGSWQMDSKGLIRCETCFNEYRNTDCCPTPGTKAMQEAALPLHQYCLSTSTGCDQQVPKNSLMISGETAPLANMYPESPYYPSFSCSTLCPLPSPTFYTDSSDVFGSCCSSEGFSPPSSLSSSSCASSPSESSCSSYQPLSSDLSYTSSSESSSPLNKMDPQTPYRMTNQIGKASPKVDDVHKNVKKRKKEIPTKTSELSVQSAPSAAFSSPSCSLRCKQTVLQKTGLPLAGSGLTFLSSTVNRSKQAMKTTMGGATSQPKEETLEPGQGEMHNSFSCEFCNYFNSTTSSFWSSPATPKIQSATPESVTHQTCGAIPRYSGSQTGPGMKNMKFDTEVQMQVSDVSHGSSSRSTLLPLSKSVPTHQGKVQMANPLAKNATVNWAATRNGKIDQWIQRKKNI